MGIKAIRLFCHNCQVPFTVHSMRKTRGRYFCPLCGESEDVKLHIHSKHPLSITKGTRPRWSSDDELRLIQLYKTTNYTYKDLAIILGKTEKAIRGKLYRMNGGDKCEGTTVQDPGKGKNQGPKVGCD